MLWISVDRFGVMALSPVLFWEVPTKDSYWTVRIFDPRLLRQKASYKVIVIPGNPQALRPGHANTNLIYKCANDA